MAETSPRVLRARQLLMGGLLGGAVAAVAAVTVCWLVAGATTAAWAAGAAGVSLLFYTLGHLLQLAFANAPPARVLVAMLAGYVLRVVAFGVALAAALGISDALARPDRIAIVVTTVAVVTGWLVAEVRVFSRQRIPVFDSTEQS